MPHRYADIFFTKAVQQCQKEFGSRASMEAMHHLVDGNHQLGEQEMHFIAQRDSFYMASISESGWPYVQHRGGPQGFVRVLDDRTLGFADFSGNRQYLSAGNVRNNNRVSLFFMDYPNRQRLKLAGRIELVDNADWHTLAKIEPENYGARIERVYKILVEAFDWNCPQHITPRYSEQEMQERLLPLIKENRDLKQQLRGTYPMELGSGPLPLRLVGVQQITEDVRAFQLQHSFQGALPPVVPGSHIGVPVRLENGEQVIRRYSICAHPQQRDVYEIAVKREPQGGGASLAIHEHFQLGMVLNCELPVDTFGFKPNASPVVFIAAGIGITAIKPMVETLQKTGGDFLLMYAGRSRNKMAFLQHFEQQLGNRLKLFVADENRRVDFKTLFKTLAKHTRVYVCGPAVLIEDCYLHAQAAQFNIGQLFCEHFKARTPEKNRAISITLAKSSKTLNVPAQQSILNALLTAKLPVSYGCTTGVCKSCAVEVVSGQPEHRDHCLSEFEKSHKQLFCPCVSRSHSDTLTLNL